MFLESWNGVQLLQGQLGSLSDFNLFTDASSSFGAGTWFNVILVSATLATSSDLGAMVNCSKRIDPYSSGNCIVGKLLEGQDCSSAL